METQIINFFLPLILVSGLLATLLHFYYNGKLKVLQQKVMHLIEQLDLTSKDLHKEKTQNEEVTNQNLTLSKDKALLQNDLVNLSNQLHELKNDEEKRKMEFSQLAQEILQNNTQRMTDMHQKDIATILQPLSNEIKLYREKVEQNTIESIKGQTSLREQVSHLAKSTQVVSEQADKLAQSLRSDHKKQGNWGEIILESILDKSGLTKDREYYIQPSAKDNLGRLKRPDVVIELPDGKKLIIDSKVSLTAFDKLIHESDPANTRKWKMELATAMKNHISQLSEKNYQDLYSMSSPDFVFMFIPLDNAYACALEAFDRLHEFAMQKNIVIVTSSTLLASLKTVESLWRSDKQNRNALRIAEEAGRMYDKLVSVLDDLEKMGAQLKTVSSTYDNTMNKFAHGQGNLISKAEKIKMLGAKTNKVLSKAMLHKAV